MLYYTERQHQFETSLLFVLCVNNYVFAAP